MNGPAPAVAWIRGRIRHRLDPVLGRELRTLARSGGISRLRGRAALVAVLVLGVLAGLTPVVRLGQGAEAFWAVHGTVGWLLVLSAPLATVDLIGRERRDGTLGLLFLTGLTARTILRGKLWTALLRGGAAWLACVPVLVVPVMLGGVDAATVALTFQAEAVAGGLAALAGLYGGVYATTPGRAVLVAHAMLVAVALGFGIPAWIGVSALIRRLGLPSEPVIALALGVVPGLLAWFSLRWVARDLDATWRDGGMETPPAAPDPGVRMEGSARVVESPAPDAAVPGPDARAAAPRPGRARRLRGRDPLRWLFDRSRAAEHRPGFWALFGYLLVLEASFGRVGLPISTWALGVWMVLGGVGWLRREREAGLVEVLLLVPGAERALFGGLARSTWAEFAPPVAGTVVAAAAAGFFASEPVDVVRVLENLVPVGVGAATLPPAVAAAVLWTRNRLMAAVLVWVLTFKLSGVLALVAGDVGGVGWGTGSGRDGAALVLVAVRAGVQLALGAGLWKWLRSDRAASWIRGRLVA